MSDQLPDTIKPQSFIDTGGQLSGFSKLAKMERLSAMLAGNDGTVEARLEFGKDYQGIRFIKGTLKTELLLTCQRCLETVSYPVHVALSLALLGTEDQATGLPDEYDPLVLDSQSLSLTTLIEDELILALPIVAMHPESECANRMAVHADDEEVAGKPNPFAALAQLKGKLNSTQ
jgi:uncharacterized protein